MGGFASCSELLARRRCFRPAAASASQLQVALLCEWEMSHSKATGCCLPVGEYNRVVSNRGCMFPIENR